MGDGGVWGDVGGAMFSVGGAIGRVRIWVLGG